MIGNEHVDITICLFRIKLVSSKFMTQEVLFLNSFLKRILRRGEEIFITRNNLTRSRNHEQFLIRNGR